VVKDLAIVNKLPAINPDVKITWITASIVMKVYQTKRSIPMEQEMQLKLLIHF
jgi:hypothetical protein